MILKINFGKTGVRLIYYLYKTHNQDLYVIFLALQHLLRLTYYLYKAQNQYLYVILLAIQLLLRCQEWFKMLILTLIWRNCLIRDIDGGIKHKTGRETYLLLIQS